MNQIFFIKTRPRIIGTSVCLLVPSLEDPSVEFSTLFVDWAALMMARVMSQQLQVIHDKRLTLTEGNIVIKLL